MRISFLVPRCTPDNSHGRYVIELAKRLGSAHEVRVSSGAIWPPLRATVHCRLLPVPNRPAIARLATLWAASMFTGRRKSTEILHIQGADAPVGNVVTAHCCNAAMRVAGDESATLTRRFNYAIGTKAERYCFSKSSTDVIIAVSSKVKREVETHYDIDPNKVVVIPHGVDTEDFHPRQSGRWRAPIRERFGLREDEFVVLFVGGDYRLKGLVPLLEAVRLLPSSMRVLAVGVKPDAALTSLMSRNGLSGLVTFAGVESDLASLYGAADAFALPTRYDTFSLATLEAMASGLPVIISRSAGVTELLSSGEDCLVLEDPSDVDQLARLLGRLVKDEKLRAGLGAHARRTAERHTWDEVVRRTLEVYRERVTKS